MYTYIYIYIYNDHHTVDRIARSRQALHEPGPEELRRKGLRIYVIIINNISIWFICLDILFVLLNVTPTKGPELSELARRMASICMCICVFVYVHVCIYIYIYIYIYKEQGAAVIHPRTMLAPFTADPTGAGTRVRMFSVVLVFCLSSPLRRFRRFNDHREINGFG